MGVVIFIREQKQIGSPRWNDHSGGRRFRRDCVRMHPVGDRVNAENVW